ncbi:transglycosylase SLT domain-containing protein [Falsirhodobacter sp. 20TX0035]|uniref:transglycosylase SLT domain-containing protein n=1 Tax=Falsirhodobacter sp. 20TX0035 TaxID=3022019 RepID=UPI0023315672|nr:transglycosylase SLT domain-containing protein [Falsirhodobacter sp. 20TX0035]MDB6454067.1 transglycosylase SLT domain-containing protein [Falsirhodobacter sp. 20TX0035]
MNVGEAGAGWQSFMVDRQARMDAASDDALKDHFAAEIEIAKLNLQAMGSEGTVDAVPPPAENSLAVQAEQTPDPVARTDGPPAKGDFQLTGPLAQYTDEIRTASDATGVPPELIAAVIWDESKGIASAGTVNGENGMQDSGLMQVNSETYAALKEQFPDLLGGDVMGVQDNIMAGALYLSQQHQQFGDWDLALRAYNSGPGSVDPSDASISTTGLGTKNYVEKVTYFEDLISRGQVLPDGYPGGNEMY